MIFPLGSYFFLLMFFLRLHLRFLLLLLLFLLGIVFGRTAIVGDFARFGIRGASLGLLMFLLLFLLLRLFFLLGCLRRFRSFFLVLLPLFLLGCTAGTFPLLLLRRGRRIRSRARCSYQLIHFARGSPCFRLTSVPLRI